MPNSFLSHEDAAKYNRNQVLHYIKKHGPLTRTDIWANMDISRASVTQVIRQLQEGHLILESGEGESTGGRKPQFISFNGAAKKLYAFDWTSRVLCLIDLDGRVIKEIQLQFVPGITPEAFSRVLTKEITHMNSLGLCNPQEIIGLGMAMPGIVDSRNGTIVNSVELGWQNVDIADLFLPCGFDNIFLERTGNIMALGESMSEQFRNCNHFQLFVLGSGGIGVSTIIHQNCQHGANYMYGELGHIKMPDPVVCSCGQQGCLEAVVKDRMLRSGGCITEEILDYLAIGVSTAINISDTGIAVLVGSYVTGMTPAQQQALVYGIRQRLTNAPLRKIGIHFSPETKQMSLTGISAYAFERYFSVD